MIQGAERVGTLAAELMEIISDATVDEGLKAEIQTVAIVCEVDIEGEETGGTQILFRCSDPRRWVQRGFFEEARTAVDVAGDEDEDD